MALNARTKLGPLLWALCVQYFLAEAASAFAYRGYSLRLNYISDLGAVHCAAEVCSPRHALMNASFVLQGLLIALGAVLVRKMFRHNFSTTAGFVLLPIAGLALVGVGLAPEDALPGPHYFSAAAHFLGAGFGMTLLGWSLMERRRTRTIGRLTFAAGIITLVATVLIWQKVYLGLGIGGMERFAAYPFTVWLVGMGVGLFTARRREHEAEAEADSSLRSE